MQTSAQAHLAVLASAVSSVELGPVGVAAQVTDGFRAYQALTADRDALRGLEPELVRLTREGSPAAIIYAALLLRGLGRDVVPLLASYREDHRPCSVFPGGCQGVTHWLNEAARWVTTGEFWSDPDRLLGYDIESLARANWFELPSARLLEAARAGRRRDGRMASGNWVFTFTELFVDASKLRRARPLLENLLTNGQPPVRLYAALLLREADRATGERALASLAGAGGEVARLVPSFWGGRS
ncbi:MAG TPA: hypothetical protein VFQ35_21345, partial [Polyangiaceae bacterium]|nr:hypothetical protein [Polyangiaceae bacterium]